MSNHFQNKIKKKKKILKILKRNHLLLYLKRRVTNCVCHEKSKDKILSTVVRCLHNEKTVKRKIGKVRVF